MKKIIASIAVLLLVGGGVFLFIFGNKKLNINSPLVQELYQKINVSENVYLLRHLYEKPGEIDNEYLISVGLKGYITNESFKEIIPAQDIEKYIYEVFGNNISFNHQRAYLLYDNYCGFDYNETTKEYEFLSGCDGMFASMPRKITEVEKKGNQIIITEKSIYVEHDAGIYGAVDTIYNNINKEHEIKTLKESEGEINIKIDDYLDSASTYKYIFEKKGENYIFKKMELVLEK